MDAFFHDVSPGTVQLTVTNLGLSTGEFVSGLYLNLNPAYNSSLGNLLFTPVSSSGSFTAPSISLGVDSFKADGDGKYDILFNFDTSGSGRFEANEAFTYTITGIPGLVSTDFIFLSMPAGGHGPFDAAIHIQGIAIGDSGWADPSKGGVIVGNVPEPSSGILLVVAMGLVGGGRWLLRRAKQS